MASVYIYQVIRSLSSAINHSGEIRIRELASLNRSHLNDRPAADVMTTRSLDELVAVNDIGEIYKGRFGQTLDVCGN